MKNIAFIILFSFGQMLGAMTVEYNSDVRDVNDLWSLRIENDQLAVVYLEGSITSRNSGLIYKAITMQFQLPAGGQQIRYSLLRKVNVLQSTLENVGNNLPAGYYTFQTRIVDNYSGLKLGEVTQDVQLSEFDEIKNDQHNENNKKNVELHLNGFIDNKYTHDFGSAYNSNEYSRLMLNASLTAFDVPLTADVFLTTENRTAEQDINQFNLQFDREKFQQILLEKCMKYLKEKEELSSSKKKVKEIKEDVARQKIEDYDLIKAQLADPEIKQELKGIEELPALKNILDDKALADRYQSLEKMDDHLLSEADSMKIQKQNINFKKEYEAIQARYDELAGKEKEYSNLLNAKQQIDDIERANVRELLSDPKVLEAFMKKEKLFNGTTKILTNFQAIEMGNLYPVYNQLLLNGLSCRGGNVEWGTGKFYMGLVAGKMNNQALSITDSVTQYKNGEGRFAALKLGVGHKTGNHLHFSYLSGQREENHFDNAIVHAGNKVLGFDFSFLFKNRISISGEANRSFYMPDLRLDGESRALVRQKGWGGLLDVKILLSKGTLYFKTVQVSSQYRSFGLPFLINGRLDLEAGIESSFWKDKLSGRIFFKKEKNNNLPGNTTAKSANLALSVTPSGKSFVNIFYNLLDMDGGNVEAGNTRNVLHNASVSSGLSYGNKKISLFSQLSYAFQFLDNKSLLSLSDSIVTFEYSNYYKQRAHTISLAQQFMLNKFSVNTTGSVSKYDQSADPVACLYTLESNLGLPLFKQKLNAMLGIQYVRQGESRKQGYYTQLSFLITKYLNFNFNLQYEQIYNKAISNTGQLRGLNFNGRMNFKF